MCTISWQYTSTGYSVFFNRDEQKTRPVALPPRVHELGSVRALMPIDPQGEGTWCAVNEHGCALALLNFYQGRLPKGRLHSRGTIVKQCAGFTHPEDTKRFLQSLNLAKFAPFSLLFFQPGPGSATGPWLIRWDGRELFELQHRSPLISSALRFEEVNAVRQDVYQRQIDEADLATYIDLHRSHLPARSELSICMHRDDAQTVSFSHIQVDDSQVRYAYTDGPPCQHPLLDVASLDRRR